MTAGAHGHDNHDNHDIHSRAAHLVGEALATAAAGNAGWLLPLEPLLHVTAHPDIWARALALLRNRAA